MAVPDGPPLARDGDHSDSLHNSSYESPRISLQSRVDSIWDEDREFVLDFPTIYTGGKKRSTSLLMDSSATGASKYQSMRDNAGSRAYMASSTSADRFSSPSPVRVQPLDITLFHETLFVGVVITAQFFGLAGLAQSIAPMDSIAEGLNTTKSAERACFTAAYALAVGTFILISGRIGDVVGHKRVFVFGYFFLGCWSAFAGFGAYVGRQIFFDICRAFQGMGAALLIPNALALLDRAYPPGVKKNLVFSLFSAMAPCGFVVGALFSSIFAQLAWWPWTFWSYGIAAWALAALSVIAVPRALDHDAQFAGQSRRPGMDWTGSALGIIGLFLISVACNIGPLFGWNQLRVYLVLIIGLFCMAGFVLSEFRAVSPILPIKAMKSSVIYTLALVGIGWGSFGIWIFYSWKFLMSVRAYSPLNVSAQFTPALICSLLAVVVTGCMLTHTPVTFTMTLALVAFFVGELITAIQPAHHTYWAQMFAAIVITPFGMDMSLSAGTAILSCHMPRESPGLAASLVHAMVYYPIAIALGIAGTVEAHITNGGDTAEDVLYGIRGAWFTGVGLAGIGVIMAALFFGRTLLKEGWRPMGH